MKKLKNIIRNYTSIPNEVLGDAKIIIYRKQIRLENYGKITNITSEIIETSHFDFVGEKLMVKEMDNYYLIITGIFKTILFKGAHHG